MSDIPSRVPTKEHRAELSIVVLYLLFFLLWCAGYAWGIFETGTSLFLGMPTWFFVSCLFAFGAVSITLIWAVRRYFS